MSGVELHIGTLVLDGFAPGDRHAITAALEHELGLLLERSGWAGGDARAVDAGRVELAYDARPAVVGRELARAIHGSAGR